MARIITADQSNPTEEVVRATAEVLLGGGVVVLPTDSVYGLACAATPNNPAHDRIFAAKQRERTQTLPWFLADPVDLDAVAINVLPVARRLAAEHWPGALTLVVEAALGIPSEYVAPTSTGHRTLAVRVPGSPLVRSIVRACWVSLAQTSANLHGEPAATCVGDLSDELLAKVDLVVDAGPAPLSISSTIVDVTTTAPRILRQGAVSVVL